MSAASPPVASKAEVVDFLRQHADEIHRMGVQRIGVFGSFVRQTQTNQSDVDVLVEFCDGCATFDNFMDLCFLLEDGFGRKVDVLTTGSLSPFIGPHILDEVEYVRLGD